MSKLPTVLISKYGHSFSFSWSYFQDCEFRRHKYLQVSMLQKLLMILHFSVLYREYLSTFDLLFDWLRKKLIVVTQLTPNQSLKQSIFSFDVYGCEARIVD
jgi:hypothetical protein